MTIACLKFSLSWFYLHCFIICRRRIVAIGCTFHCQNILLFTSNFFTNKYILLGILTIELLVFFLWRAFLTIYRAAKVVDPNESQVFTTDRDNPIQKDFSEQSEMFGFNFVERKFLIFFLRQLLILSFMTWFLFNWKVCIRIFLKVVVNFKLFALFPLRYIYNMYLCLSTLNSKTILWK